MSSISIAPLDNCQPFRCGSVELPSEILSYTLSSYCSWGDLAKLATVQKSWSCIMYEAAEHSLEAKWQLAQALLDGTHGLQVNSQKAMQLFVELSLVTVDENNVPVENDTNTNSTTTAFTPAMRQVAQCYLEGKGVEADPNKGLAWWQATHMIGGDVEAAHQVALLYEFGRYNVSLDVVLAAEWLTKAATAGHVEAMAELGLCYELGCGVEASDETALDWYIKAAELGHVSAKYSVGECFEEARGVPQSDAEACLWYYKAALEGDEDSKQALLRLHDIARIVVPGVGALLANVDGAGNAQ